MNPLVGIILVNYNNYIDTIDCIESLQEIHYDNYIIVVIDNHSSNNSVEQIKKKYNFVNMIRADRNLGFAGGNNLGIKIALEKGVEYILLLNNDTVADKLFLNNLIKNITNSEIRGPKICYFDKKNVIWSAGGYINYKKGIAQHYGINQKDNELFSKNKDCTFLTGCCWFFHKDIIEKVGYLDESYFMYTEDLDYCIRAINNNIKLKYIADSIIYHKVSSSSGGDQSLFSIYYTTRNRFFILNKYKDKFGVKAKIFTYITRYMKIFICFICSKNYKIYQRAMKDYKQNKMGKTY